tara:strand:+ start:3708 stop:4205 length:498 start_codon:yes stop_codon:yes gene_type:complete
MIPYFKELKVGQFYDAQLDNIIWNPETEWIDYFNFTACLVPHEIVMRDHFYKWLYSEHPFKAGILKMEHQTMYNWHTDSNRGVCINMLIQSPNTSYTFFRNAPEVNHTFIELRYFPGTRYLFNNQKEHMVLNYDGPRFILTTEFLEDKNELTFKKLQKKIEKKYG